MMSLEDLMKERLKKEMPEAVPDGTSLNSTLLSRSMDSGIPRDSLRRVMEHGKLGILGGVPGGAPPPAAQPESPEAAGNAALRRLAKKSSGQMSPPSGFG